MRTQRSTSVSADTSRAGFTVTFDDARTFVHPPETGPTEVGSIRRFGQRIALMSASMVDEIELHLTERRTSQVSKPEVRLSLSEGSGPAIPCGPSNLVHSPTAPKSSEAKRIEPFERGSFTRSHDGDRHLTTYEVHALRSSQGQPREDVEPVDGAVLEDLDPEKVKALLDRMRRTRSHTFGALSDNEILDNLRVTTNSTNGRVPTLGGLLSLGKYPQKYFPQLNVSLVVFPTVSGEGLRDGTRFLDSQTIDGSIPEMVAEALSAVTKNLTRRSVIAGVGREDKYEYPIEAIREVIANSLIHRDYHPLARGTQVRIELYPDRIEVISPGGIYGTVPRESLMSETVTSSRNAFLAKLLEDVEMPGTSRTICENRGSGLLATAALWPDFGECTIEGSA